MPAISRLSRGILAIIAAAATLPAFAVGPTLPPHPQPLPTPPQQGPSTPAQITQECIAAMHVIALDTVHDLRAITKLAVERIHQLDVHGATPEAITAAGDVALEAIADRANEGKHDVQDEAVGCLHILQQMHAPNAFKHAVMDARTREHRFMQDARQEATETVEEAVSNAIGN